MTLDSIVQLEDAADKIQHTRKCETEYLYEGYRCQCGVTDIREAIANYRNNVWMENRSE